MGKRPSAASLMPHLKHRHSTENAAVIMIFSRDDADGRYFLNKPPKRPPRDLRTPLISSISCSATLFSGSQRSAS